MQCNLWIYFPDILKYTAVSCYESDTCIADATDMTACVLVGECK
jgi:hypothetical protein